MSLRYRIVVGMCQLLRHPDQRIVYADGSGRTRCPCGHIDISDRPFAVTVSTPQDGRKS